MSDSLVLGGAIELLGGEAVSANPRCPGAQIMLAPGFDFGAGQPTTDFVASLILDGERPFGRRSSNRTITLPIVIQAPTRAILAAAREVLEETIDQDAWSITWTRDPGPGGTALPLVFDCFRAQPSVPVYNTSLEKQQVTSQITVTIPALPYGRSDTQQQIAFAAPVPQAPPPPPSPVVLDSFTTINSTQCAPSTLCVVGPSTCYWDPLGGPAFDPQGLLTPLTYGPVILSSALNLTGMTSLQVYLGLASRYYWNHRDRGGRTKVSVYYTLYDSSGNQLSFGRDNQLLPVAQSTATPAWSRVTVSIPQNSTTFNYASVAAYQVTIINRQTSPCLRWIVAWLDALTAYPASQTAAPVTRGNIYTLYGWPGTVHAPVSLSFQQAPVAGSPTTITTAGAGNYTVPGGTIYLEVTAIGGGGAGATQTVTGFGGGGGGGESATEPQFVASPAQVIPYSIGAGGTAGATPVNGQATVFGPAPAGTVIVQANGGMSAAENTITGGLGGSGSTNSQHYPGGTGRTASGSVGGGGGSSAGPAAPGNTPTGTASTTLTGSGNWLCPTGVTQVTVTCIGAGGSGGDGGSGNGGGGGGGESATQTLTVVPGTNYAYVCGTGGASVSSTDVPGNAGGNTTFTVGSTVLTGHGGGAGTTSTHNVAGGAGGSGSSAPVHYSGGAGGSTDPYTGGGGSSAGTAAPGNAGNGYSAAGAAPSGGGAGGAGTGPNSGAAHAGSFPGGGGGGTWTGGYASGAGANGQITVVYPSGLGAPTNTGATAPSGGGAGGAGGPSSNTAGTAGTAPGGGGGGGDSAGSTEAGGAGAAGKLIITPFASPAFKTLIVHRPAPAAPLTFMPMVSVGGGSGVPNGSTQYTMPQPVSGVSADFDGTYTVILTVDSWNSPSAARTIYVTVYQYEYSGGASHTVSTVPVTITPNANTQISNGILIAGVLTLPSWAVAQDNAGGYYTISVTDTNTSDRFYDCLLLDSQGQTMILNRPAGGYINMYVDEPDPTVDIGRIMGSQFGRPDALSITDGIQAISGGPFTVEPNDNLLFAYCMEGAPAIGVSGFPRWYFDRTG